MVDGISYELLLPEREDEAAALVQAVFNAHVAQGFSEQGCASFADFLEGSVFSRRAVEGFALAAMRGEILIGVIEVVGGNHVALFFVSPDCQGQGVGRTLMCKAVRRIRRDGPNQGALTVNASPNSVGAYAEMGFIASGPEQEKDGIRFIPMSRTFDNPDRSGSA